MIGTIYHCPECERDVDLASDAASYCPVCSSALIQAAATEEITMIPTVSAIGPEIYLG